LPAVEYPCGLIASVAPRLRFGGIVEVNQFHGRFSVCGESRNDALPQKARCKRLASRAGVDYLGMSTGRRLRWRAPGGHGMELDDYLRDQASNYRQLACESTDDEVKEELLDLAAACDEVANNIEDRLTGG